MGKGIGVPERANPRQHALAGGNLWGLDAVQALNDRLEIPRTLVTLHENDIAALAKAACWEADTNYPVPRQMTKQDCERLLREILPVTLEAVPRKKTARPASQPKSEARRPEAPKPGRAPRKPRSA